MNYVLNMMNFVLKMMIFSSIMAASEAWPQLSDDQRSRVSFVEIEILFFNRKSRFFP